MIVADNGAYNCLSMEPNAGWNMADLEEIYDYIAADNPRKAGEFIDLIQKKCRFLAAHPQSGRQRPELRSDLHSFPVKRYVIFYRIRGDAVEVVNVIHSARDIESGFAEDD